MNTNPTLVTTPTATTPAPKTRSGRTKGSVAFCLITIKDLLASGALTLDSQVPVGRKFLNTKGIVGTAVYASKVYAPANPTVTAGSPAAETNGAPTTPKVQATVTDLDAVPQ